MDEAFEVTHQGAILLDGCSITVKSEKIIAIAIITKSRYGQIMIRGVNEKGQPILTIEATKHSSNLNACKRSEPTEICFPEYVGWTVFSVEFINVNINVCLIRNFGEGDNLI